jgi:galactofuranosylgalactofuranosylrhamnosyl-N-acetylglucosaminyl-diphospho-decaprenol beta-1,5/1,6-galactofuranosyltransferase
MSDAWRTVVWRTVFPVGDVEEVLPLYIDGDSADATPAGRHGVHVRENGQVSLGSYFNAFPAGYWHAETGFARVHLRVRASGRGFIQVMGSDATARSHLVADKRIEGDTVVELTVQLETFATGGALWIDLHADANAPLSLHAAEWSVDAQLAATATIAMATFNRPSDCLAQLALVAADEHLGEVIDRVVVVDQGDDLVSDQTGFAVVADSLGERLVLVRQPNLGGSGGFSRGMYEALRRDESTFVLLLDDDAVSDPEAIVRAVRLADAAPDPLIVGGGMLHLDDRTVLYAQSEQWDPKTGWVRLNRAGAYDHDFARVGFRDAPFFHGRETSDFTGWWMCLIPTSLLREIGLALPVFLKGDDVEFALRARERGVSTVSVPGIALWHMGWGGKAPTRTWEAYFLHRNRLITELLHSPYRRPTGLLLHSFLGDVKPLLTLQYSAVRLRAQAIADVLGGPDQLPAWLATRAGAIRGLWRSFSDAVVVDDVPPSREGTSAPRGRVRSFAVLARVVLRHLFVRADEASAPRVHVMADRLGWWSFADVDAALVDTADGTGRVRYRRSRGDTRRALWLSVRLHAKLWAVWPRLAHRFRASATTLASAAHWARVFEH